MAKQGKMYGSPFHVEDWAYKYAVEHENDGMPVPQKIVQCDYIVKTTKFCTLWNSGLKTCMPHKCPLLKANTQNISCKQCAYYLLGCKHPKKDMRNEPDIKCANYCVYFIGQNDKKRFYYVRRNITRIELASEIESLKKKISKRNRYIRGCEKELLSCEKSSPDYVYFTDKIIEKKNLNDAAERQITVLIEKLDKLGGPLSKNPSKKVK